MKVPLLDLKPQYNLLKKELDEAVLRVIRSQHFILGPEVENMEKTLCNYLNCKYAIGVSSGTDALLLALMALGIGHDDEVIVPTYSFFATAGVVSRLNATPVLTDIDPVTFNIDPEDFKEKITGKTRAVIPVHLYGQSCDMESILTIARENNIRVIEDAAQAIGAQFIDNQFVGTFGDFGCFSFFPSKNLGCFGDGGLLISNDEELAHMANIMRVHGGEPKYHHKVIGGNFRLDAIQAAVISVKLPYLDEWSEQRRRNARIYTDLFINAGLAESPGKTDFDDKNRVLLPRAVYENSGVKNYHIFNQYIIRVEKRDQLRKFLAENEITTEIYYPIPFHLQECFAYLKYKTGDFPKAEIAASASLALPIYPELSQEQIIYVVDKIKEFMNQ